MNYSLLIILIIITIINDPQMGLKERERYEEEE